LTALIILAQYALSATPIGWKCPNFLPEIAPAMYHPCLLYFQISL
jgi:hypothetical protein